MKILWNITGYPSEVQVLFNDNEILIAEHFSRNQRNYSVEYLSDGGMIHPKKNPLRRGATIHSQELVIHILIKWEPIEDLSITLV